MSLENFEPRHPAYAEVQQKLRDLANAIQRAEVAETLLAALRADLGLSNPATSSHE